MTTPPDRGLRTSLHRVADAVEPLPVADDLWRRGQAARRRGQALVVAAVLAVLASLGGVVTLVSTDREVRTATAPVPDGGAIPSRIDDVPEDLEMTTDLAVGRASAAFISATGDVVVITATDGVPHRLALPGWDRTRRVMALSADGRMLAYQRGDDGDTVIARLDLESGRDRPLYRQPGEQLTYDAFAWSPGGEWLTWSSSRFGTFPAVGKVRADKATVVALPYTPTSAVATDDGQMAIASARGAVRLEEDGTRGRGPVASDVPANVAGFSPDGRHIALATGPDTSSYTLDVERRRVVEHPFPEGTIGESVVRPLGWVDDRLQLLLVQPIDNSGAELVVTTPEVDATSTWRGSVGSVGSTGVANSLSLAVDLVPDLDGTSSQQLTHDFGDTPADNQRDISWLIGLGVAAAIAVLMALRWLWRRLLP